MAFFAAFLAVLDVFISKPVFAELKTGFSPPKTGYY